MVGFNGLPLGIQSFSASAPTFDLSSSNGLLSLQQNIAAVDTASLGAMPFSADAAQNPVISPDTSMLLSTINAQLKSVWPTGPWYTASTSGTSGSSSGSSDGSKSGSGGSVAATSGAGITENANMKKLAEDSQIMLHRNGPTEGECVRGVNDSLQIYYGHDVQRVSDAYMEADVLAKNPDFTEVTNLSLNQLKDLPAGCIIVWSGDLPGSQGHGHATITQGNGQEISDHQQSVITSSSATFRVFIPKA